MFFDWNIDLFCMNDGGSHGVWQTEGLLHIAVDLEQVVTHFANFYKI